MTEIIDTFESVCPGVFGGFMIRNWDQQPVLFQPDEGIIHLKDLRGNYIFTENERITCCIAKNFDLKSKLVKTSYKNEQNYNIGHIGKVNPYYLGNIGQKSSKNPFTEYIHRGLQAHLESKGINLNLRFVSKLEVDRRLENLPKTKNADIHTLVSSYNIPEELQSCNLSSVAL
jgi:hypothetical protein